MNLAQHYQVWQFILAAAHYAAATAIVGLTNGGKGWEVPVIVRFNVWTSSDGRCSGDTGCTINEYERMLSEPLNTGILVASFSYISGSHHALSAIGGSQYVQHLIDAKGVSVTRWVDYAFSASLMLMMDSVLWLAPPTVQMLVLVFCVMFLVIVSGYGSEVAWSMEQYGHAWLIYVAALAPFVCVWIVTWSVFAEGLNPKDGAYGIKTAEGIDPGEGSNPPDFVIVILAWLFFTYSSFPIAHAWRLATQTPATTEKDVILAESVYSFLSFFAKIPLLAVYGTAVAARTNRITVGTPPPKDVGPMSDDGTFVALGTSIAASFVLGILMTIDLRRAFKESK